MGTSPVRVNRAELDTVRGRIAYARRTAAEQGDKFVADGYDIPMAVYEVAIRNGRPITGELSLEREGFVLARHPAAATGDVDRYLQEMTLFVQDYFKASWVVPQRAGAGVRADGFSELALSDLIPVAGPVL